MFLTRFFIGKPLLEDSTFHRKIGNKLREYYKNPDAEIVIVTDVRQIGKSFIVCETAKTSFPHFVEINMQDDLDGNRLFADVKTMRVLLAGQRSNSRCFWRCK